VFPGLMLLAGHPVHFLVFLSICVPVLCVCVHTLNACVGALEI